MHSGVLSVPQYSLVLTVIHATFCLLYIKINKALGKPCQLLAAMNTKKNTEINPPASNTRMLLGVTHRSYYATNPGMHCQDGNTTASGGSDGKSPS